MDAGGGSASGNGGTDMGAAAFLIRLGLGDRIVGTARQDFTGDLAAQVTKVKLIDPGHGTKEALRADQTGSSADESAVAASVTWSR